VTGANVLVAIFAERESHAAYFLQEQDMTRYDAVNFIAHGIAKVRACRARPVRAPKAKVRREGEDNERVVKKGRRGAGGLLRRPQREGPQKARSIR
jgi:ATP-dependent Clp protease ATP-binding subunit ClpA